MGCGRLSPNFGNCWKGEGRRGLWHHRFLLVPCRRLPEPQRGPLPITDSVSPLSAAVSVVSNVRSHFHLPWLTEADFVRKNIVRKRTEILTPQMISGIPLRRMGCERCSNGLPAVAPNRDGLPPFNPIPRLTRSPRPPHDPSRSPPPGTPRSHTAPRRSPGRTWRRQCSHRPGAVPVPRDAPATGHVRPS